MMPAHHDSVLLSEAVDALAVRENDVVVDATTGGAGHFAALLAKLGADGVIVGIDADTSATERAREAYALDRRPHRPVAHLVTDNFRNLTHILERLGIGFVDKILFDLGWSGYQLAEKKGFSFSNDEPLLMTYGGVGETAADIVNTYAERDLADLIYLYGEERHSRKIASAIVIARAKKRILTTGELVEAILAGTPSWYQKKGNHPATKTFQALRIAVNDEFGALKEGLVSAIRVLAPQGRLAVISFHSGEDRIVKEILRDAAKSGQGKLSPKKPLAPSRAEILANRRSRSAKLRVFERAPSAYKTETSEKPLIHAKSLTYA